MSLPCIKKHSTAYSIQAGLPNLYGSTSEVNCITGILLMVFKFGGVAPNQALKNDRILI